MSILSKILLLSDIDTKFEKNSFEEIDKSWWHEYYSTEEHKKAYKDQSEVWKKLQESKAPSKCILPLTVRDPRVVLPKKKEALSILIRGKY